MNENSMRFRIGVFVLSSLILLAVLIILFGGYPSLFKRHDRYSVVFQSAPGVEAGTPVRRSGVRIGQAQSVALDDATGKVRVTILIDRPHPLYQTDRAVLVHGILSGDTSIDFVPTKPGQAEVVPIEPNTELIGGSQADVATLLNQTSDVVPNAQEALIEIRKTLSRYEKMAPLVEETLKEYRDLGKAAREVAPEIRELAKAAREGIPDLRRTNDEMQVTIRNWGKLGERLDVLLQTNQDKIVQTLERLGDTIGRVALIFNDENQKNFAATLRNVSEGSKSLDSLAKSTSDLLKESLVTVRRVNDAVGETEKVMTNLQVATKPLAERSETVMKNLDESTGKLNKTLDELREMLKGFNAGDGTIRRFLNDPALYNNLNDTIILLSRSLPRIDQILRNMEVFADKLARHPELLGVRGAVAPSSGLKESPFGGNSARPIYPNP